MCGIIGYAGRLAAGSRLLAGLSRLEYRGYDSAGVALVEPDGIELVRSVGRLSELKAAVAASSSEATTGIGHTR